MQVRRPEAQGRSASARRSRRRGPSFAVRKMLQFFSRDLSTHNVCWIKLGLLPVT